jgi:hypothetical protein
MKYPSHVLGLIRFGNWSLEQYVVKKTKIDSPKLNHKIDYKIDHKIKIDHKMDRKTDRKTERRRNARFPLGLPVRVHLTGHAQAMTVELMDLSAGGGRFRSATSTVRLQQTASLAFLLPGPRRCLAKGRVVRTDGAGEFALQLQGANKAFIGFIAQLSGQVESAPQLNSDFISE